MLPYLGAQSANQRSSSYPTFTEKVICELRGKLSAIVGLLDIRRASMYGTKRATERAASAKVYLFPLYLIRHVRDRGLLGARTPLTF